MKSARDTPLTEAEIAAVHRLHDPVDPPPQDHLVCELGAGHDDAHLAFVVAVAGGEMWWWLRWSSQRRELVPLEACPGADRLSGDDCLLPVERPGLHSFEF
jgi:hypothetical protein